MDSLWIEASPARLWSAVAVIVLYVGLCLALYHSRRRKLSAHRPAPGQHSLLVAFASQTGSAEQLAEQTAHALRTAGVPVALEPLANLRTPRLAGAARALFVVSTTGEGDAPDNASGFTREVMQTAGALPGLRYGVLALGDREYRNFCGFGRRLDTWLRESGAQPLFDPVEVDNGDEQALQRWREHLTDVGGEGTTAHWKATHYDKWRLTERTLANPGSAGEPTYYVTLTPLDPPTLPDWQPGDLIEILPRPGLSKREFSIASLPNAGCVELLVRVARHPDGSPGVASGLLTQQSPIGAIIDMRVRPHREFRQPSDERPMIFICNGTGIAGLRPHLKRRAQDGHNRNWLIFGERNKAHDFYYREEIEGWLSEGVIERLDCAFSRDQDERIYVQNKVLEAGDAVRSWVQDGASIYVCGSLEGMAPGVESALVQVLGSARVDELRREGRYRRDVY
jgi:sulfite reductase (NADPH) flavoprotein alpha-component